MLAPLFFFIISSLKQKLCFHLCQSEILEREFQNLGLRPNLTISQQCCRFLLGMTNICRALGRRNPAARPVSSLTILGGTRAEIHSVRQRNPFLQGKET